MEQLRPVSKRERILFPIIVTIVVALIVPDAVALVGMLMLGNLIKESGVADRLAKTAQNGLMNVITIFLGLTVGATAKAETFLTPATLGIVALGLIAFCFSTAGGLLLGKLMCKLTHGKVNPLIGSAGVSAVFTLLLTEMEYISAPNGRSVCQKQSLCSGKTEPLLK